MMKQTLQVSRLVIILALAAYGYGTYATFNEKPPVTYIQPLDIVEKEGGYRPGDDLLVKVHLCIHPKVNKVFYRSVTQTFVSIDGTNPTVFTDTIRDLSVTRESLGAGGIFYSSETHGGIECFLATGTKKHIPETIHPGEYKLMFSARVDGTFKEYHEVNYETVPFTILP